MEQLRDINPIPRFLTQRDNINPFTNKPDPDNQCMVANFTMLTNWLGDRLQIPELQKYTEFEHLKLVGKSEKEVESRRYISINHAIVINDILQKLKLKQKLVNGQFNWMQVKNLCKEKRSPVEVGSMITKHGHIILYIGNNEWHDPYGKCSESTLSYFGDGFSRNGERIIYSEKFITERIFRESDKTGKTLKINTSRLCWYFTGL